MRYVNGFPKAPPFLSTHTHIHMLGYSSYYFRKTSCSTMEREKEICLPQATGLALPKVKWVMKWT